MNKKRFFCISNKGSESASLLKESAEKMGLEFILIDPLDFDYSSCKVDFKSGDILYRVKTGKHSRNVEIFLMNRKVTTFFSSYERALLDTPNLMIYHKNKLPTPRTVFNLTKKRDLLKKYAKYLGGFPLIIKAVGGSHGVGVMKIDSFSSLLSVTDFILKKEEKAYFVMKEFINVKFSARLIVLGNKVIDSIEYVAPEDDFRSNEGKIPNVRIKKFPKEVEKIAVSAAKAIGVEFAGVDILIDAGGKYYLAETNFPCFFPRAQKLTGTKISDMMVDYLLKKANKS